MMDALGKIITESRLRRQCLRAWSNVYKEEMQAGFGMSGLLPGEAQGALLGPRHAAVHLQPSASPRLEVFSWAPETEQRHSGADPRTTGSGNRQELPVVVIAWRRCLRVRWGPWEAVDLEQPEASHDTGCPGSLQTQTGVVNSLCM